VLELAALLKGNSLYANECWRRNQKLPAFIGGMDKLMEGAVVFPLRKRRLGPLRSFESRRPHLQGHSLCSCFCACREVSRRSGV
jgi:hypothetical protein